MARITDEILSEIGKVILGKDQQIRKVLMAILAQGHILLEDVPGTGKTTLANAFAKTLGLQNKRVQFTSDTLPSDIIGFSIFDKATDSLKYQPGAIMTNLLLADEINRTSSKTQSALLEAMEEKQVTVDGETRILPKPFVVLATQNPAGSAGTQMLPTAQLDRFLIKLSLGYPDRASQVMLMRDRHMGNPLDRCQAVTDAQTMENMIQEAMGVYVADSIYDYVSDLADASREDRYVMLGISPRGALAICRAAKANAYLEGRDYVTPEDVAAIFTDVCAHRIVLSSKAKLHEHTPEMITENLLQTVAKPGHREFKAK